MRGSLTTTAANEGMDGRGWTAQGWTARGVDVVATRTTDTFAAVAAAVRARLDEAAEEPASLAALRRDGLRAVRGDHGAAGVLPDADGARDPRGVVGRDHLRCGTAAGDRRAGRRLGDEDLSLARRRSWPGSRPRSTRRSTSRRRRCGWRSPSCDGFGGCACGRSWRAIPKTSVLPERTAERRLVVFLGSNIGNYEPSRGARAVGRRAPPAWNLGTPSCSAPTWRSRRGCSAPLTTTRPG